MEVRNRPISGRLLRADSQRRDDGRTDHTRPQLLGQLRRPDLESADFQHQRRHLGRRSWHMGRGLTPINLRLRHHPLRQRHLRPAHHAGMDHPPDLRESYRRGQPVPRHHGRAVQPQPVYQRTLQRRLRRPRATRDGRPGRQDPGSWICRLRGQHQRRPHRRGPDRGQSSGRLQGLHDRPFHNPQRRHSTAQRQDQRHSATQRQGWHVHAQRQLGTDDQ